MQDLLSTPFAQADSGADKLSQTYEDGKAYAAETAADVWAAAFGSAHSARQTAGQTYYQAKAKAHQVLPS